MRRVRVSNVPYLIGLPYRDLAAVPFIDYQEDFATANAIRLHERDSDVALISSTEYAMHGGYVSLGFGVACTGPAKSIFLCAQTEISELTTIYVYKGSSSSAVLLRLLLADKWNCTPRIVRVHETDTTKYIGGTDGALVMDEMGQGAALTAPIREDLSAAWYDLTGLPFVYLLWCMRPGALSAKRSKILTDLFHRCVTARDGVATRFAEENGYNAEMLRGYLSRANSYYLDAPEQEGLRDFFRRACRRGLIPEAQYRGASFSLIGKRSGSAQRERSVQSILEAALENRRLNVRDAVKIAEESTLADIGLVAEGLRGRVFSERSIGEIFPVEIPGEERVEEAIERVVKSLPVTADRVILVSTADACRELSYYEALVHGLRASCAVVLEGFSVMFLRRIAEQQAIKLPDVISRLVAAGLQSVPAFGGGMLISRVMRDRGPQSLRPSEWLDTMRIVHRLGARSSCCMTLHPRDSWEDRILHLRKLRTLQDEVPGFRYFYVHNSLASGDRIDLEEGLRATAIARIFLDNVPNIEQPLTASRATGGVLNLSFGANEVRLDGRNVERAQLITRLQSLLDVGVEVNMKRIKTPREGVH